MSEMLYFAKQYAAAGLAIIPLKQDKTPYTAHGLKDASTSENVISEWWQRWPRANIGIVTGKTSGGIFVVDQDEKNGEHGIETFSKWIDDNTLYINDTWESKTASGGRHTFFRSTIPVASRIGWLDGVDVRGEGGYIVAPPSVLADGSKYEWLTSPMDLENPISNESDPNVEFIVSEINKKNNSGAALIMPEKIDQGNRNDTLYRLACSLQARGVSDAAILAAVQAENTVKCDPPLDNLEVARIVQSACTKDKGNRSDDHAPSDLDRFHLKNEKGKVTGAYDYEIHRYLKTEHHIFVLGGIPYIYEDGAYRPDLSGAMLKTMIRRLIYPQFVKSTTIKRIYDLFMGDAELQRSFEDLNQYPAEWICFHNGFFDPINKQMIPHDPKYMAINQVACDFDPEAKPKGETVQKWLDFITEDPSDREMLLQYAGYCLTRDTRQQKFLILQGEGGSGKSTVINMIELMIGPENISNISLGQLTQRFSTFNLLGKLLNSCADLEVTALEDVSTIKKLLGEDSMSGEAKGKDIISFRSYAKLIFSTNELPIVKAERSNGFYRRLLIFKMDKLPEVRAPDFLQQLSSEIDYFIHECVDAVCRMYEDGTITESAKSKEEVLKLRCDSDTVEAFLNEKTLRIPGKHIRRSKLYLAYESYCREMERQSLTRNNFFKALRIKGFSEGRADGGHAVFKDILFRETVTESITEDFQSADNVAIPFIVDDK